MKLQGIQARAYKSISTIELRYPDQLPNYSVKLLTHVIQLPIYDWTQIDIRKAPDSPNWGQLNGDCSMSGNPCAIILESY